MKKILAMCVRHHHGPSWMPAIPLLWTITEYFGRVRLQLGAGTRFVDQNRLAYKLTLIMHRDIRRCRVDYYARLSKTTLYECGDAMMPKCVNRMNTHTYGYLHRIRTHTCGSETRVMHVKSFIRRSTKSKSWMLWTEHKYARKSNYMDENTHNTWKWRRQRWWLRSYTAACQRPHHQTHTLLHAILWPTKIPHSWRKRMEKDKCMVCVLRVFRTFTIEFTFLP